MNKKGKKEKLNLKYWMKLRILLKTAVDADFKKTTKKTRTKQEHFLTFHPKYATLINERNLV